jgi:L-ascorbate metabolism protein UlaG (beta-lactamase superfamily)
MKINENIFWIGHASFYIKVNGMNVFIDPFKVSDAVKEKADLILITHAHMDHNNRDDIEKVRKSDTKFIAAQKCLDWKEKNQMAVSKPGFKTEFNGIKIEAVPAYNLRPERLKNHPKEENWVGYIIEADGARLYHAGDTDIIPEMKNLKNIDIALLPMGGTYTMSVEEGIEAAGIVNAKTIVPMHYKMLVGEEGSKQLEEKVKSKLKNAVIMKEVQKPNYSF